MDSVEILELWSIDEVEEFFKNGAEKTVNPEEFEIRHGDSRGYLGFGGEELELVDHQRLESFVVVQEDPKLVWVEDARSGGYRPAAELA